MLCSRRMYAWLCADAQHYIIPITILTHSVVPCVPLPEDLLCFKHKVRAAFSQPHVWAISVDFTLFFLSTSLRQRGRDRRSLVYDAIFRKAKVSHVQKHCVSICRRMARHNIQLWGCVASTGSRREKNLDWGVLKEWCLLYCHGLKVQFVSNIK